MSIFRKPRPGVLEVSPPDELEMPDSYLDRAREQLRSDRDNFDGLIPDIPERDVQELAESLWLYDIEDSRQAAAEYAADLSDY